LADAVEFLLQALDDESLIHRYQPMKQDAIKPSDFAWMMFWQRHYVDQRVARHLSEPMFNRRIGGNISAFVGHQ
jgi:hypothetical protein